jgi:hypothetical protein
MVSSYLFFFCAIWYSLFGSSETRIREFQILQAADSLLYYKHALRVNFSGVGVKRSKHGVDHDPNLAPKLKNEYNCNFTVHLGIHDLFYGEI